VATMEKANRATERLAKTTGDSYKTVIDHVVALQERNTKFVQEAFGGTAEEIRRQAESNWAVTQELVERAEKQRDAIQTLFEESVDAYMDLVYAPFAYYRQGLRVIEVLDGLTAAEIREVREYEKRNKSRETLIEQLDRKLKAASA
jgi:hypothetical protein